MSDGLKELKVKMDSVFMEHRIQPILQQNSWKIKQSERWSYLKVQYHFGQISHLRSGHFMRLFLYQHFHSYNEKYIHFVEILAIPSFRPDTMCHFEIKIAFTIKYAECTKTLNLSLLKVRPYTEYPIKK